VGVQRWHQCHYLCKQYASSRG
jgi:hypothetical protein